MDQHLQPAATTCAVTQRLFEEAERITSFLVRDPATGEVARQDVAGEAAEGFVPGGTIVCSWTHAFKPRRHEEDPGRAMKLTAENLFLELADPLTERTPEVTRLIRFLALLLERKRVLRRRGSTPDGAADVLEHLRSRQRFEIPAGEMDRDFFVQVQAQLDVLVGGARSGPDADQAPDEA
jgi:hypothetical protein